MSHITAITVQIKSLAALRAAVAEFGAEFIEGKTTYEWYGRTTGPVPAGLKAEELGKCSHVIRIPGVKYEIGVVHRPDGTYTLAYDSWGDGQGLLKKFGEGCGKLVQSYAVHTATMAAKAKGMLVRRQTQDNGAIKLVITQA